MSCIFICWLVKEVVNKKIFWIKFNWDIVGSSYLVVISSFFFIVCFVEVKLSILEIRNSKIKINIIEVVIEVCIWVVRVVCFLCFCN